MPGHASDILHAHPELGCFSKKVDIAKKGGIFPIIFCSGKEEVFIFIENLIKELVLLFPYQKYRIGGDETYKKEWESCPECQRVREEHQLTSLNDRQGYFSERIIAILKKYGKEAIDFFTKINSNLGDKEETLEASNPNKEFGEAFMKKFFHPLDLPALFLALMKGNKK